MLYFPEPYPDELVVSVVARYHVHTMSPTFSSTLDDLFGPRRVRPSVELPCSLGSLEDNTYHLLRRTADEFIWTGTMFPYYTVFLAHPRAERIRDVMTARGAKQVPLAMSGLQSQSTPKPQYLRSCPACIAEDIAKYGETYWHRAHQLRAVHTCLQHKCALMNTPYPFSYQGYRFSVARADMQLTHYLPDFTSSEWALMLRISAISCSYLNRSETDEDFIKRVDYRQAIQNSNYFHSGRVKVRRFCKDFNSFFGPTILGLFGMSVDVEKTAAWLKNFVRNPEPAGPTTFILLKLFFQKCETSENVAPAGPWRCQNVLAKHHGELVITSHRQTLAGNLRFMCSCGMVFLSKRNRWTADGQPIRHRTTKFSPEHMHAIRERWAAGTPAAAIVRELQVSKNFIAKILYKVAPKLRPDPKAARRALEASRASSQRKPVIGEGRKIDWERRDSLTLAKVQAAVMELRQKSPPVRISRSAVGMATKLSILRNPQGNHRLKQTTAFLIENLESVDDIRVRAVIWHFQNWPVNERVCASTLKTRASVFPKHRAAWAMANKLVASLRHEFASATDENFI